MNTTNLDLYLQEETLILLLFSLFTLTSQPFSNPDECLELIWLLQIFLFPLLFTILPQCFDGLKAIHCAIKLFKSFQF